MGRGGALKRILVGGISGAGKSTMARRLAGLVGVPYVEMDALHHGAGWVKRPEFERDVDAFSSRDAWVTEDQYHTFLGDLLWRRADTFVWLDYRRPVVMRRVIWRSASRAVTRRELWNGNREDLRTWVAADHPIRWAWSQHGARRVRYEAMLADPAHAHLEVVRLRRPGDARQWVKGLRHDR